MSDSEKSGKERRRFPRIAAHVYYRIAKSENLRQRVSDISMGGVRLYSDERFEIGQKLDLELFFPNDVSGKVIARVVWIKELPPGAGAIYDVGLEFLELPDDAVREELADLKK